MKRVPRLIVLLILISLIALVVLVGCDGLFSPRAGDTGGEVEIFGFFGLHTVDGDYNGSIYLRSNKKVNFTPSDFTVLEYDLDEEDYLEQDGANPIFVESVFLNYETSETYEGKTYWEFSYIITLGDGVKVSQNEGTDYKLEIAKQGYTFSFVDDAEAGPFFVLR
ncbi:MAG: hypothetical protein GX842_08770 [Spirochaetales bacterium]|nr:hypothetical protein [Spirochaetales bacterium]